MILVFIAYGFTHGDLLNLLYLSNKVKDHDLVIRQRKGQRRDPPVRGAGYKPSCP